MNYISLNFIKLKWFSLKFRTDWQRFIDKQKVNNIIYNHVLLLEADKYLAESDRTEISQWRMYVLIQILLWMLMFKTCILKYIFVVRNMSFQIMKTLFRNNFSHYYHFWQRLKLSSTTWHALAVAHTIYIILLLWYILVYGLTLAHKSNYN